MARKVRNSNSTYYYLWINLFIGPKNTFTTDMDEFFNEYEGMYDTEDTEEEKKKYADIDWLKYDKECRERRAAKEAQSSEQKKA